MPIDKLRFSSKIKMIFLFWSDFMEFTRLYLEIVRYIHYLISNDYFFRRSIARKMDFSRKGKMSFTDYIYAIIQNTKTSLQAGLNAFFENYKKEDIEYSKQAFSKGRQRIKVEAFQELSQAVVEKFYEKAEITSWKEFQLFGIDGTHLNLPCTDELAELYGTQVTPGESQVQALVSCVYDLTNGMIVDTRFAPCNSSERVAAKDMIAGFHVKNITNPVFVMDRGYPSAELIDAIEKSGHKYIMRYPSEFLKRAKVQGEDTIIEHKFAKLKYPLKLRVLKIQLPNGINEHLVTNIFDSDISLDDFKWVYQKRWGIETKYDEVKNKLEVECFTGYSPKAILQDFYSVMFLGNLVGVLEYDLHEEIEAAHRKPENLYAYKMNIAMTISELKRNVVEMLATSSRIKRNMLLMRITSHLKKAVLPERKNRSAKRVKKHKAMKYPNNSKRL